MHKIIKILLSVFREIFAGRVALHMEILALRQQVAVLKRKRPRPSLRVADRVFWVLLSCLAQQIREAFPWDTAPRSPWQNPYVERLIGSVRRECLDHVIILNEPQLRRILGSYLDYYHGSRTHLSLGKDTPDGRPVQPAGSGQIVCLPKVGGLHHRYERLAA